MIAAWLAVAFLWGAAIALCLVTWYFRRTFVDLSERLTRLEGHDADSTVIIASSYRDVLERIAAILDLEDDDEPTRTH